MAIDVQEDRKIVQILMQGGLAIAVALMGAGVLLQLTTENAPAATVLELSRLFGGGAPLPELLLGWGVLILALTPALRVAMLAWLWVRAKDWVYAAVSGAVLLTLALAIAVGGG